MPHNEQGASSLAQQYRCLGKSRGLLHVAIGIVNILSTSAATVAVTGPHSGWRRCVCNGAFFNQCFDIMQRDSAIPAAAADIGDIEVVFQYPLFDCRAEKIPFAKTLFIVPAYRWREGIGIAGCCLASAGIGLRLKGAQ